MSNQHNLTEQLTLNSRQIEDIVQKVSALTTSIARLTQKYNRDAVIIQGRITKVQFSRPRDNPANQWPHCPMTNRVQAFYQAKETKESRLRQEKDLLKHTFDHRRATLTCERQALLNLKFDLESQNRIIYIQLHRKN